MYCNSSYILVSEIFILETVLKLPPPSETLSYWGSAARNTHTSDKQNAFGRVIQRHEFVT